VARGLFESRFISTGLTASVDLTRAAKFSTWRDARLRMLATYAVTREPLAFAEL
jgi:hypothetical protein